MMWIPTIFYGLAFIGFIIFITILRHQNKKKFKRKRCRYCGSDDLHIASYFGNEGEFRDFCHKCGKSQ